MTRISPDPYLPIEGSPNFIRQLRFQVDKMLRDIAAQLNGLTEGKASSVHNAMTSVPTSGTYARGDFILNSEPQELGSGGSMYVIHGWRCVTSGEPGTWKELRCLTGN